MRDRAGSNGDAAASHGAARRRVVRVPWRAILACDFVGTITCQVMPRPATEHRRAGSSWRGVTNTFVPSKSPRGYGQRLGGFSLPPALSTKGAANRFNLSHWPGLERLRGENPRLEFDKGSAR